jgi:hypothetical protein
VTKPSTGRGRRKAACVVVEKKSGQSVEEALNRQRVVLDDANHCLSLQHRKEWWAARCRLNTQLRECMESVDVIAESLSGCVHLFLGRHLHKLSWECLEPFQDVVVTRLPSLRFAAAHQIMVCEMSRCGIKVCGVDGEIFRCRIKVCEWGGSSGVGCGVGWEIFRCGIKVCGENGEIFRCRIRVCGVDGEIFRCRVMVCGGGGGRSSGVGCGVDREIFR